MKLRFFTYLVVGSIGFLIPAFRSLEGAAGLIIVVETCTLPGLRRIKLVNASI